MTLPIPLTVGGVRGGPDEYSIPPDRLVSAVNVDLGPNGELHLRRGFAATALASPYNTANGFWVRHFKTPAGADTFIVLVQVGDDFILLWVNTAGALIDATLPSNGEFGADAQGHAGLQSIVMNDTVYVTSANSGDTTTAGDHGGYKFNGVTQTELTRWGTDDTVVDEFPFAGALCVAYDRVFAANVMGDTTPANRVKERLFFSEPLLPESWSETNFIDIAPDENSEITALCYFGDQIIIFKESSMWGLAGSDFDGLGVELYKIADYGTVFPESIVINGSRLFFLDPSKGIFAYDGSGFENIGGPVFDWVQELVFVGGGCHAWYFGGAYNLRVTTTASLGTLVYNLALGAWTTHDWAPASVAPYFDANAGQEQAVGVGAATDGIWTMYFGYKDGPTAPVRMTVKTAWLSPATDSFKHRLSLVELLVRGATPREYGVSATILGSEGSPFATQEYVLDAVTAIEVLRTHEFNGVRWRAIQFTITSPPGAEIDTPTSLFTVSGLRLQYSALPRSRGESYTLAV